MAWAGVGRYPHSREQPSGRLSIRPLLPSLLLYPIILKWSPVDEKSRILIIHKNLKSGTWIKRHATNGTAVNTDVGRCCRLFEPGAADSEGGQEGQLPLLIKSWKSKTIFLPLHLSSHM